MIKSRAPSSFLPHRPFGQPWYPCFFHGARLSRQTVTGATGTSGMGLLKSPALLLSSGKRSNRFINAAAQSGDLRWSGKGPMSNGMPRFV